MRGLRRKESDVADYERAMALGLSEDEWLLIKTEFARDINEHELLLVSALWSEKGSNKLTGNLLEDLRETAGKGTMTGPAGIRVLELDDGRALGISLEQNNAECASFPFNGASVGAGLAIDRLIAAGFEPSGVSKLIRVGDSETAQAQRGLHQMVSGVASLLNHEQIALLSTDFYFHQQLNNQTVFNVAAIGLAKLSDRPVREEGPLEGSQLVSVGLPGTTAAELDPTTGRPRPIVRMANALQQHLLAGAFAEAYRQGLIVDVIGLGGIGLLPNIFNLAYRHQCGFDLAYDKLPFSSDNASLFEVLSSQTPHRFLALVEKKHHRKFNDLLRLRGLKSVTVGDATSEPDVNFSAGHYIHAGLPYRPIVEGMRRPGRRISRTAPMVKPALRQEAASLVDAHGDLNDRWIGVLAAPNLCSRGIANQYSDNFVGSSGLEVSHIGASILPLKPFKDGQETGLACSFKANSLYALVDPYLGTVHTVAEAVRAIAAVGGRPIAMGTMLNVGDYENRKVQLALAECGRALSDASRMWELPLLDEMTNVLVGREANSQFMTPAVFVVGYVRDLRCNVGAGFKQAGDKVLAIGSEPTSIACSEYSSYWKQPPAEYLPEVDFEYESRLCSLTAILVAQGLVQSAHSSAFGGLGLTLAQCCFGSQSHIGVELELNTQSELSLETLLFGEAPGQVVLSFRPDDERQVKELIAEYRIPVVARGNVGGRAITCSLADAQCSVSVKSAGKIWREGLSHVFPVRDDTYTAG